MANGVWGKLQTDVVKILNDSGDLKVYDSLPENLPFQFMLIESWAIDPRRSGEKSSRKLGDSTHCALTLTAYTGQKDKGFLKAINMIEDATCLIADNGSGIRGLAQLVTTSYSGSRTTMRDKPLWAASATIEFYLS